MPPKLMVLAQLVNKTDSGLPIVVEALKNIPHSFLELRTAQDGENELVALQVTTRSPMGALAHAYAGVFLHHGFVRLLGAGRRPGVMERSIVSWSSDKFPLPQDPSDNGQPNVVRPGGLMIADDVLGGAFAINGGAIEGVQPGHVAYFDPATLEWEDLGFGYTNFLEVMGHPENFESFYGSLLWSTWKEDIAGLTGEEGLSHYPPLWSKVEEGKERSRRKVPFVELWNLSQDMAKQLRSAE